MQAKPTHLTKHGVKQILEEFEHVKEQSIVLQVIEVKSFEKKNITARITLSDGVSKMFGFMSQKAHDQLVSNS